MIGRYTVLLLFSFAWLSHSWAQTVYELQVQHEPLENVLTQLESRYGFRFSYVNEDIDSVRITAHLQETTPDAFLAKLFKEAPLDFELIPDDYVIIRKRQVEAMASVQTWFLKGRVIDAATDQPISFANLSLQNTRYGSRAEEDGRFQFSIDRSLGDTLVVSRLGYETRKYAASEIANLPFRYLALTPKAYEATAIVIADYLTDGVDLKENGSATVLRPEHIQALPGQGEPDVLTSLQFLPGISAPDRAASNIYIRGGTPDQNLIRWEGIPIYQTAYFFGTISAFNPQIMDRIEVYRGGFGAAYGGRISGVIDMYSADHQLARSRFGLGVNGTNVFTDGKISLGKGKVAVVYSGRRSFQELWRSPTYERLAIRNLQGVLFQAPVKGVNLPMQELNDDFSFGDAHLKVSFQATDRDEFSLAGFAGQSDFVARVQGVRGEREQTDSLDFANEGLSLFWGHRWAEIGRTEVRGLWTQYQQDYRYRVKNLTPNGPSDQMGSENNVIQERQLQIDHLYQGPKGYAWRLGYHLTDYEVSYQIRQSASQQRPVNEGQQNQSLVQVGYLSLQTPELNPWGIEAGLRTSYYALRSKTFFAPRLRAWYKVSDLLSFHLNAGQYYQFISQLLELRGETVGIQTPIWVLSERNTLPVIRARQFQVGGLLHKQSWVIDVQAYFKQINGLSSLSIDFAAQPENQFHIGEGNILGLDLLLKKRWKYYKTWVSYSLSQVEYTFPSFFDPQFPAPFDQRHILNWVHLLHRKQWEFSLGFKVASGMPYALMTNFTTEAAPMGNLPLIQPVFQAYNSERLPWQHQLDASLLYQLTGKRNQGPKGTIGISALNLYNRNNLYSREYFVERPPNMMPFINFIDKSTLGFTPNFVLRLTW